MLLNKKKEMRWNGTGYNFLYIYRESESQEHKSHKARSITRKINNMTNKYLDGDSPITIQFSTLRNISTKQDVFLGRKILMGLAPISQLIKLGKDSGDGDVTTNVADKSANVRNPVKTKKDGRISVKSGVPAQIYNTLENDPDQFHLLNNGITILCDRSELHPDKENLLSLKSPSIANGGHTHDVIREFVRNHPNEDALCKVEIIYIDPKKTVNQGLNDEISIARNTQKAVKAISIAGKRGILDDLHFATDYITSLSETDTDLFDAQKAIQIAFLLTPDSVWHDWGKPLSRPSVYSGKTTYLKKYVDYYYNNKEIFNFLNKIVKEGISLYQKFQRTEIIKGTLKQIKKNSYTELKDGKYKLKDGWILPIISALSHYVDLKNMKVKMPSDEVLKGILAVIYEYGYREHTNPQTLAKTGPSYTVVLEFLKTNFDFVSKGKQVFR